MSSLLTKPIVQHHLSRVSPIQLRDFPLDFIFCKTLVINTIVFIGVGALMVLIFNISGVIGNNPQIMSIQHRWSRGLHISSLVKAS